ncbi:MAG: hypothetical protein C4531_01550 [Desulfurivibrio sp.]|nr:MAG: hypothetical protein C4531_01550 [Desulfurivibrio sp.]
MSVNDISDYIIIKGKSPSQWIEYGSEWEDDMQFYAYFSFYKLLYCHFYNPLSNMGYTAESIELGQSLIDRSVNPENEWAIQYAKLFYYSALTGNSTLLDGMYMRDGIKDNTLSIVGTTKMNLEEKEQFFAWMFQALGHTMHLIQDASVPAHTRNDLHNWSEPFEVRTKKFIAESLFSDPQTDPNIFLNSSSSIIAPYVFFDTGQLDDTSESPLSGAFQGLAEYSHANFLSNHTIFGFDLPEAPSWDENPPDYSDPKYVFEDENINLRDRKFIYMKSPYSDGVDHFVRCGILHLMPSPLEPTKAYYEVWYTVDDSRVNDDYAAQLIPRAVGYSAAFLDHFFRGQLEVSAVNVNDSAPEIDGSGTVTWLGSISHIKADVQNVSTLGDQAELIGPGSLIGITRYVLAGVENYSVSQEVTLSQAELMP